MPLSLNTKKLHNFEVFEGSLEAETLEANN